MQRIVMDSSLYPEMKNINEVMIKLPKRLGLVNGPCLIQFDKNTVLVRHIELNAIRPNTSNVLTMEKESLSVKANKHIKNHYKVNNESESILISIKEKKEAKVTHVK